MKCNLSTTDRAIRCIIGVALIGAGLVVVKGALGIIVALIGGVLIFSGTVGFCHVYKVLHISTSKKD